MKCMTEARDLSAATSTVSGVRHRGASLLVAIALMGTTGIPVLAQSNRLPPVESDRSANPTNSEIRSPGDARFSCQLVNGQHTVIYHPESRPNEGFPWAVPSAMGGGWTADRRCIEISRRLEEYRPDGLLELQTGQENGYNIVCVTTQDNDACRIVFTVPPGQDPLLTRDLVFQNITTADTGAMTQGVNTYTSQSGNEIGNLLSLGVSLLTNSRSPKLGTRSSIPLRPFLDAADGGTGQALKRGIRQPAGPRLNPINFR